MRTSWVHIIFFLFGFGTIAQVSDTVQVAKDDQVEVVAEELIKEPYNPLAPSTAAFYSAVLPGLGQAYNKRYWKIPIVYAGLATGVYFYIQNDNDYNRFRDAYKRRLAGFTDDEFYGPGDTPIISDDRLIDAQKSAQKNKDYSLIVVLGFYVLNIIDANVDAHLRQYNVSKDLSLSPGVQLDPINAQPNYSLSFTWDF